MGTKYQHLFWKPSLPPPEVILAKHVTAAAGTSLVHTAPAHGQEDYEAYREAFAGSAQAQASEMRCPVDDEGKFTNELADWTDDKSLPERLVGKSVLGEAVPEMISILKEKGILLHTNMLSHRYPCDWKTKEPVILRYVPLRAKTTSSHLSSLLVLLFQSKSPVVCQYRGYQAVSNSGN